METVETEIITPLSEAEARKLTEEIKSGFYILGEKILEAYRRRVWEVLGYANFTSYTEAEFGLSHYESYRIKLNTLTTLSLLPELGKYAYKIPGSQKELLHKLPSEKRAEGFREAQQLAQTKGREKPTAKDVRQVVEARVGKPAKRNAHPQSSTTVSDDSDSSNLTELREKLRRKTRALEEALRALIQLRKEASKLRRENQQLQNLLNSLGG